MSSDYESTETYNYKTIKVNVRLELHETCIIPSLLHNMEAWNKQSKGEIKKTGANTS